MADTIEKIYCTDGRDNDLAAILAATKNNDSATMMAAMGGGMNNWMNNPFVYLVWMMFANRMWGGEQNGNPALKKEQETETRLKAVEGSVQEVKDLVKTLVEKLS